MRTTINLLFCSFLSLLLFSCKTAKKISTAISPRDTSGAIAANYVSDSSRFAELVKEKMRSNFIDVQNFSAKIKVDVEDGQGKQPDVTANVRMIKDSVIWISLTASFLNIEAYRARITKDSVILLNKLKKEVQYRSLEYLQEVTNIPFDFETLQNLLLGNPVFFDSSQVTFRRNGNFAIALSVTNEFKNLLTLSLDQCLLQHSKMDDTDHSRNRTADITYDGYEQSNGKWFATKRQIIVAEKTKLIVDMDFKQYEFNKELSVSFSVPKNYKRK